MPSIVQSARNNPDRLAVIFGNGDVVETYGQLELRSRRLACALRSVGLASGDSVALLVANEPTLLDLYWATQRIGLYLTPVNWHLSPAEIAFIVQNCDAKAVIVSPALASIGASLASVDLGFPRRLFAFGGDIEGFERLDGALDAVPADPILGDERPGSVVIYSSGTTGKPKGIRRPLPNFSIDDPKFIEAQTRIVRILGFNSDDRYLCPAPLYHAAPIRSCAAVHLLGGTVLAMPKFDAELALQIIQDQQVTVSQWVPTHFKRLVDLPPNTRRRFDVSSLRVAVHAAAPCPTPLKRAMIDWWGPILVEYYAGTEGGGTVLDSHEWLAHPGSVGKPWAGVDVGIFDANDKPVRGANQQGAVYFRDNAPGMRFEYYKNEALTQSAYRGDWFSLGDMGYFDAEGYLYLTDRQSNMIISGGVNIYPQEAENCLMVHPKVYDVAVIGVPDEEMGEQVRAFVIAAPDVEAGPDLERELIDFARSQLAHFKCPKSIVFVTQLPRTETGKLQKRLLLPQLFPIS